MTRIIVREDPSPSTVPRLRAVAVIALLSIAGVALALWLVTSAGPLLSRLPWMRIETVEIRSEWPLTGETLRGYLPTLEGTSLLAVQPSEIIGRLLDKPWVNAVTLKKEYPNRLFLDVTTKRARAVVVPRGEPWFVDDDGKSIERARPALLRALDLPVIQPEPVAAKWDPARTMRVLEKLRRALEPEYRVSEVALEAPPYFRVYLTPVRAEIALSLDSFDAQLPRLRRLLDSPSFPKWQPHRINLVFPKKAIVSAILSK